MRKTRYSEEQDIGILREAAAGVKVAHLTRKHGISEQSFYRRKAKYGGMEVREAKRLRHLDEENRQLKPMVADLRLDIRALKSALGNEWRALRGVATWQRAGSPGTIETTI